MTRVQGTYVRSGAFLQVGWTGVDPGFEAAVGSGVDYVGADAGTSDFGAVYLGGNRGALHTDALRQLLDYLLSLTTKHNVPLLIGSANVGGTADGVRRFQSVVDEVARERGLHFRAAFIDSEVDRGLVAERLEGGFIRPLGRAGPLTAPAIDESTHIVAQMGAEPYIEALRNGAQVIVGGRTSDPALFAAVPLMRGIPPAVSWHMAKVLDHGHFNIEPVPGASTWVIGEADETGFEIRATSTEGRCTALRVARATLHESPDCTRFFEPPGMLDISACEYEQVSSTTVRVTGSVFETRPYTLKLEGARLAGFRSITICGFRSPEITTRMSDALQRVRSACGEQLRVQGIEASDYTLDFHCYGLGEILRQRELPAESPREVGIVADCVASTQEIAGAVISKVAYALHVLGREYGLAAGPAAFPFSPVDMAAGPVHTFHIWHVMDVDDPLQHCQIRYVDY